MAKIIQEGQEILDIYKGHYETVPNLNLTWHSHLSLTAEGQPGTLPTLSFCDDTVRSFSLNHLKLWQSEKKRIELMLLASLYHGCNYQEEKKECRDDSCNFFFKKGEIFMTVFFLMSGKSSLSAMEWYKQLPFA